MRDSPQFCSKSRSSDCPRGACPLPASTNKAAAQGKGHHENVWGRLDSHPGKDPPRATALCPTVNIGALDLILAELVRRVYSTAAVGKNQVRFGGPGPLSFRVKVDGRNAQWCQWVLEVPHLSLTSVIPLLILCAIPLLSGLTCSPPRRLLGHDVVRPGCSRLPISSEITLGHCSSLEFG